MPYLISAVKGRAVVGALARQLDEVADVIRRLRRKQVDHDRAGARFDHGLFTGELSWPKAAS